MNGDPVVGGHADQASGSAAGQASGSAVDRVGKEPGELNVTLSPRQIVGGFAVVAGLIVWLIRRARRGG